MGLFEKVKNMFTDEVEDEVKTGMIQVEISAPTKEETNDIADNEIVKSEEKPAPIFFDDDYFKELEAPKKEVKSSYKKEVQENKVFKPTPIISPVYGVLDKNYYKEEIKDKKPAVKDMDATIDDIRKKAFGTLEDDLETTLFGSKSILFNEVEEKPEANDLFEEMTKDEPEDTVDVNLEEDIIKEDELFDLIDSMYEGDKE